MAAPKRRPTVSASSTSAEVPAVNSSIRLANSLIEDRHREAAEIRRARQATSGKPWSAAVKLAVAVVASAARRAAGRPSRESAPAALQVRPTRTEG